jgi:hypothetical protein
MSVLVINNPLIRCARIEVDKDGDSILVVETTAVLDCNSPSFDQGERDGVERDWLDAIHANKLCGGKLIEV